MTYAVTTNTPIRELIDGRLLETTCGKTTRRTVGTLEEAHFVAARASQLGQDDPGFAEIQALVGQLVPEEGGVVTFPDGTRVEIELEQDELCPHGYPPEFCGNCHEEGA